MALILDFSKPRSLYPCGPAVSWATALLWARRHAGSWGHTQGLGSGREIDGACRVGLPEPGSACPESLCCAGPCMGSGAPGRGARALRGGPSSGCRVPLPPSSLSSPTRLVTRPGPLCHVHCGSWQQPHFPALIRVSCITGASSSLTTDLGPQTYRPQTYRQTVRPTDRQHCRGSLSNGWRRISRHREFQKGVSLLRTNSQDNEDAANAVGWPPDRPWRAHGTL